LPVATKDEDDFFDDVERVFRKAYRLDQERQRAEIEGHRQYYRRKREKEEANRRSVGRLLQLSAVVFLTLACIFGGKGDFVSLIAAGSFALICIFSLAVNR